MHRIFFLIACSASTAIANAQSVDLNAARKNFAMAREICQADAGKLWGVSLCGPILFVDPQTHQAVANEKDGGGVLKAEQGVFVGVLPRSINVSNTALEWSGTRWTQIMWPLPDEETRRDTLLAHELFHRIQNSIAVPKPVEVANDHLDSLEGRYWMQLEWRALDAALKCKSDRACREAVSDALLFRAERYRIFPAAVGEERSLELNEGLAEYTGVKLGNRTDAARLAAIADDLSMFKGRSFVRSFAYATGAPYGLLLDKYSKDWRGQLLKGFSLSELLKNAAAISLPPDVDDAAKRRAVSYDGQALRQAEEQREEMRLKTLAANRKKFVDGAVLMLPLQNTHMNVQFNPTTLQPLDKLGTVYPTLRVSADWGVLEVENGALMKSDWSAVYVAVPAGARDPVAGEGWKLALKGSWKVTPSERSGDFKLIDTR